MATITPLPGTQCLHHCQGRCLYEEDLNPGYHQGFRCRVMSRWEAAYDDFLIRAEAFGLDEATVAGLWGKRFASLAGEQGQCPEFAPSGRGENLACARLLGDVCLLAFPLCAGMCRHFQPRSREPGPFAL